MGRVETIEVGAVRDAGATSVDTLVREVNTAAVITVVSRKIELIFIFISVFSLSSLWIQNLIDKKNAQFFQRSLNELEII